MSMLIVITTRKNNILEEPSVFHFLVFIFHYFCKLYFSGKRLICVILSHPVPK